MLRGYLNTVASLPGEGKTATLTGLAWQASRPDGGSFAGRRVWPANTVYVDFDAPGDGRNFRYWLEQHARAYPDGDPGKITLLEPDIDTYGLNEQDLKVLVTTAKDKQAGLVIIDSFMAAFPTTDPVKLTQVQAPLWYLRRLATEAGAAVVLIDHLPKPMAGERAGARGVMGSIAKPAQSRSVHLLTRVPLKEVNGRHVLKWEAVKLSYCALPEPFGVELRFNNGAVTFGDYELPAEYGETRTDKAVRAIQDHLETNRGAAFTRKQLLELATKVANVSQRTAEAALKTVIDRLGDDLVTAKLPGAGAPVTYQLTSHQTLTPDYVCGIAVNATNAVQDDTSLTQSLTAEKGMTAVNFGPNADTPPGANREFHDTVKSKVPAPADNFKEPLRFGPDGECPKCANTDLWRSGSGLRECRKCRCQWLSKGVN